MHFLKTIRAQIAFAAVAGLLTITLFHWQSGPPATWPDLLVPFSLFAFVFGWTLWLSRQTLSLWALACRVLLGAILAHVIAWAPFLWRSYGIGHGPAGLDYSLASGIVTAALVGWYVFTEHLWQTALLTCAVFAGLAAPVRKGNLQ